MKISAAQEVRSNFNRNDTQFSWLENDLREYVCRVLESPMPRGRTPLYFRQKPEFLNQEEVNGKHHIIFLSYYPNVAIAKKSAVLRDSGHYYTTLIACCVREDNEPLRYFDQVYEVNDYHEMMELAATSSPWRFHALIHPSTIGIIAVTAKMKNGTRTVIDVNDSMLFIDKSPNTIDCRLEKSIIAQSDFFLHKQPSAAVEEMRSAWGIETPDAQIHSLPLRQLFSAGRCVHHGSPAKLVFAGGVMPYHIATSRGHEGHVFDPIIHHADRSAYQLTFFVNQNARNIFWEEHERYLLLQKKYKNFAFKQGVPFFRLPSLLSKFDFGLYYENSSASSYNPKHFQYNMATKIFSYIEGALPVLVPETSGYLKRFILEHGLGITYDNTTFDGLVWGISDSELEDLKNHITKFREECHMHTQIDLLRRVYDA
jgi:hypothetical protein